jgi:hypothetical protein
LIFLEKIDPKKAPRLRHEAEKNRYIQTENKTENTRLRCGDRRAGGCFFVFVARQMPPLAENTIK